MSRAQNLGAMPPGARTHLHTSAARNAALGARATLLWRKGCLGARQDAQGLQNSWLLQPGPAPCACVAFAQDHGYEEEAGLASFPSLVCSLSFGVSYIPRICLDTLGGGQSMQGSHMSTESRPRQSHPA